MPIISVIIPSHCYGHFLYDAFKSIVDQDIPDFECIVISNGATDQTTAIVKQQEINDPRFSLIEITSGTPASARNVGIEKAKGLYIQFLDADDVLLSEKWKIQLDFFNKHPETDIHYGNFEYCDLNRKKRWIDTKIRTQLKPPEYQDLILNWEYRLIIPIHTFLFRRSCFNQWGKMDPSLKTHEDLDLYIRFSLSGAKWGFTPKTFVLYRIHTASNSRNDITSNRKNFLQVLEKYIFETSHNKYNMISFKYHYIITLASFHIGYLRRRNFNWWIVIQPRIFIFYKILSLIVIPIPFMNRFFEHIKSFIKAVMSSK